MYGKQLYGHHEFARGIQLLVDIRGNRGLGLAPGKCTKVTPSSMSENTFL